MTFYDAVEMLRERRALVRIGAAICQQTTLDPEWTHVLTAIGDRLKWSDYALKVSDPELLARAGERLDAEPDAKSARFSATDWAAAWKSPQ